MDWHFRVNQRSNETEKRGLHRSWLVDEMVRSLDKVRLLGGSSNNNRIG